MTQEPPDPSIPRWSPDRMWWWDGVRWVLANPAVMAPPPRGYSYVPPPYLHPPPGAARVAPRGLRVLLIVMLAIAAGMALLEPV